MEQALVKSLQTLRPALDQVRCPLKGVDGVIDVLILQQPAPFRPQLGQSSVDLVEFGGAGVSVQQPSGLELADAMALFTGLGDGPIDGQHGGIVPLERVPELLHLFQRRQEDNSGILLQLVVHPHKGGVQSGLRDSAHSAFRRAFIVLATDPYDQAAFPYPSGKGRSALATVYFS